MRRLALSEKLRVLGLYARRYLFGKSWAEHAASLRKLAAGGKGPDALSLQTGGHAFDSEYGTSTGGAAHFFELASGRRVDAYATAYVASQPSLVRRALRLIPAGADRTFVDLGCGEGRALIVASEFPFRAVLGVELSPALCATASANAALVAQRFPERPLIQIVEADAAEFPVPNGDLVVFLYHPFQKPVMKRVRAALEKAWRDGRRNELYLIYLNPVLGGLFDCSAVFQRYYAGMLPLEASEQRFSEQPDEAVVIWKAANDKDPTTSEAAVAPIRVSSPGWRADVGGDPPQMSNSAHCNSY